VIGNDLVVTLSAEGGQLQLNAFEPVIAAVIFESQTLLRNAARTLRVFCVEGITANPEVLKHYIDSSIGTVTALNPVIGYERAAAIAKRAYAEGRPVFDVAREMSGLSEETLRGLLDPAALTRGGLHGGGGSG
jgi:aspartate ammonia-lyase